MTEWFRPVTKVGDVIVVGEEHRERSSRGLMQDVWDEHNFDAVCVEAHPSAVTGWRDDNGGAIGLALVTAEQDDVPRYYVDNPQSEMCDGFGGKVAAYAYLKGLKDRVPTHEDGLVDENTIKEVRGEIREEYGEKGVRLILEEREERMARRAKWAANHTDSTALLVVGSAHQQSIVEKLRGGVEPLEIEDKRKRTGERIRGGPFGIMSKLVGRELKRLILDIDWRGVRERITFS